MRKSLIIILLVLLNVVVSSLVFRFLENPPKFAYVEFVSEPRLENESYGFLKINSKDYYQIYTTTQVEMGNGLHYHKIGIRGSSK